MIDSVWIDTEKDIVIEKDWYDELVKAYVELEELKKRHPSCER